MTIFERDAAGREPSWFLPRSRPWGLICVRCIGDAAVALGLLAIFMAALLAFLDHAFGGRETLMMLGGAVAFAGAFLHVGAGVVGFPLRIVEIERTYERRCVLLLNLQFIPRASFRSHPPEPVWEVTASVRSDPGAGLSQDIPVFFTPVGFPSREAAERAVQARLDEQGHATVAVRTAVPAEAFALPVDRHATNTMRTLMFASLVASAFLAALFRVHTKDFLSAAAAWVHFRHE